MGTGKFGNENFLPTQFVSAVGRMLSAVGRMLSVVGRMLSAVGWIMN